MTLKILFTIALVAFLAGPQLLRLVRSVRDALRARVRVGQQSIVLREDGVRMRETSRAWWSLPMGWRTVDVVVGTRDVFLFTRPLFGVVPRPVYRLVRGERDERGAPGIALAVTRVTRDGGRVVVEAGRRVVRLTSRAPAALCRALEAR